MDGFSCAPNCNAGVIARNAYFQTVTLGRVAVVIAIVLAIVLFVIWRRRRVIAAKVDDATVATLAAGLRAGRKVFEKGRVYRQRIVDRAGRP